MRIAVGLRMARRTRKSLYAGNEIRRHEGERWTGGSQEGAATACTSIDED